MSQIVQATLEGVYPRDTSKGTVFDVKADGVQYNTWDGKLADKLGEMRGAPVAIEFEVKTRQSGDKTFTNRNIVNVIPLGGGASTSDNGATESVASTSDYQAAKNEDIRRQVAVKAAGYALQGAGVSSLEFISYADDIFQYLNGTVVAAEEPEPDEVED